MSVNDRLERLQAALFRLGPEKRLALAYSGGLDSRTLALCAKTLGFDVTLYHLAGAHLPAGETAAALERAAELGLPCRLVSADPFAGAREASFGRDRCYVCKKRLFSALLEAKPPAEVLIDGTNADDLKTWRPGLRALRELGVASPLAQAELTKADVRALARALGLSRPDQPSKACLLTRFDYGAVVTPAKLAFAARAEEVLAELAPTLPARVREVAPGKWALHLDANAAERLGLNDDALLKSLSEALGPTAPELTLERLTSLSGYFDRHR